MGHAKSKLMCCRATHHRSSDMNLPRNKIATVCSNQSTLANGLTISKESSCYTLRSGDSSSFKNVI